MSSLVPFPLMFFFLLSIPPISNFNPSHTLPRFCLWPSPFPASLHLHMFHLSASTSAREHCGINLPSTLIIQPPPHHLLPSNVLSPSSSPNPGLLQLPPPPLAWHTSEFDISSSMSLISSQQYAPCPTFPHNPPLHFSYLLHPLLFSPSTNPHSSSFTPQLSHSSRQIDPTTDPQILSKTSIPPSA